MSRDNTETRTRILNAAWKLLEAHPGKEVRMSDIAKAAEISRQAVYLHFPTRVELLVATTRYIDEIKDVDARLLASRTAKSGVDRLVAFVEAWGNYIPEIHGVARALMAMQDTDEAAKLAWVGRIRGLRQGFDAAITALEKDGKLSTDYSAREATDLLMSLLSVQTWEQLTQTCGWSQQQFVDHAKAMAVKLFVAA
jgi:AcrR family transcriptional regulator